MQLILLSHYFTLAWLCHRCQLGWISRGGGFDQRTKNVKKAMLIFSCQTFYCFFAAVVVEKRFLKNKNWWKDFLNVKWHIDGVTVTQLGGSNRTIVGAPINDVTALWGKGVNSFVTAVRKAVYLESVTMGERAQILSKITWRHLWTNSYQINCDNRLKFKQGNWGKISINWEKGGYRP